MSKYIRQPGRVGVTLTIALGACLLVWGVSQQPPSHHTAELENGMGGPSEPPITTHSLASLAPAATPLLSPMAISTATMPTDQLGPLHRLDEGPVEMRIAPGQTFYEALEARDVSHTDIMSLVKACKSFRNLRSVRTGELFRVDITNDGGLRSLGFDLDEESHVTWVRDGDTYTREDGTYPVEHRLMGISGTINASLYATLDDLDAPLALASKMNDILGWDVDFSRDLRKGDTFRIVYEEIWKNGEFVRTGAIQALELVNRGKLRNAYRFEDAEQRPSYYNVDGVNMQKQLMRAPVNYSRISSGFSYRRFHPVLKRWMPHLGVDYAAPLGTPIRAAGNGTVVAASRKKGNGRYVQIRHTNREYETYYLHLSRFAKNIRKGTKVTQGQIIGYVGATGYATGPHLDYRVKKSGKFVNPRKLKLPAAAPVAEELMDDFNTATLDYQTALAQLTLDLGPMAVLPPVPMLTPPAWDQVEYVGNSLPAMLRPID